jgi:hypothetical protein
MSVGRARPICLLGDDEFRGALAMDKQRRQELGWSIPASVPAQ